MIDPGLRTGEIGVNLFFTIFLKHSRKRAMFRVTRAEEQAIRLIMRLAHVREQITLSELAEAEDLPEPTVAKLLNMLRKGGVVEAVRGRNGGYALAGSPNSISAGQVIRCISGEVVFGYPCNDDHGRPDCPRTINCGLRPVWRHIESRVEEVLSQTTIADLLKSEASAASQLQELWPLSGD